MNDDERAAWLGKMMDDEVERLLMRDHGPLTDEELSAPPPQWFEDMVREAIDLTLAKARLQ
jgi:hypothetical protein